MPNCVGVSRAKGQLPLNFIAIRIQRVVHIKVAGTKQCFVGRTSKGGGEKVSGRKGGEKRCQEPFLVVGQKKIIRGPVDADQVLRQWAALGSGGREQVPAFQRLEPRSPAELITTAALPAPSAQSGIGSV
jgi:hypothetical protein